MRVYTADMIPGGASPVINVSQYDNDYAVTVTLIEGAEIYTPPIGATIRVEGTKPDGHGFEYPCTYQGNVVTMPIYTQMTVVSGRFPIELVVYQSGLRVGSCNIIFAVEKAPLGEDTDISETVIPDIIDAAQSSAEAAQSSAEAAQEAAETAQEAAAQVLSSQIVTEASGSIASFSDGADDVAVKSLVATITPVQSGTGDPSPTNIRPISGRTGLTVTRAGKNLIPNIKTQGSSAVVTLGQSTATGREIYLPAGTYTLSYTSAKTCSIYYRDEAADASGTNIRWVTNAKSGTITLTEGKYIRVWAYLASGISADEIETFQIEEGSTATAYEPYTATTIPLTWETIAGTVYGGTLDVVSGVLTVDRALYTAKWGDGLASTIIGGFDRRRYNATPVVNMGRRAEAVCNIAPYGTGYATGGLKFIIDASVTTATRFYVYLPEGQVDDTQDIQIAWAIQPQTYQLTPQEIRTLLGVNNMWSDGDSMDVTYVADTKMYIDNKIAALQALVLEH